MRNKVNVRNGAEELDPADEILAHIVIVRVDALSNLASSRSEDSINWTDRYELLLLLTLSFVYHHSL